MRTKTQLAAQDSHTATRLLTLGKVSSRSSWLTNPFVRPAAPATCSGVSDYDYAYAYASRLARSRTPRRAGSREGRGGEDEWPSHSVLTSAATGTSIYRTMFDRQLMLRATYKEMVTTAGDALAPFATG